MAEGTPQPAAVPEQPIAENEQVKALLELLQDNTTPGYEEFAKLIGHVSEMEQRLSEATEELKAMRQEMQETMDSGSPYSEAYQLYIQEHGSPLWAVPPRPVLEPAIEHSKDWIAEQLSKAAQAALDGNVKGVQDGLHKAGQVAENAARDWFTDPSNGWPPNSATSQPLRVSISALSSL